MEEAIISEEYTVKTSRVELNGISCERILFKTHFIQRGEDIIEVIHDYAGPFLKAGDVIFVSEKALANSQKRSIHVSDIKPGLLARLLYRFVRPTKHGRGIGTPEKMEMAIRTAGTFRILLAAVVSAVTKLFGLKGYFYNIAGEEVRRMDGQSGGEDWPYHNYVILTAENPDQAAGQIKEATGCEAIVADINDLGGSIVGFSSPALKEIPFLEILKDNPMGQESPQTPVGIIRMLPQVETA